MSQVERDHLFVHIQRRTGGSSEALEHRPSWAQTPGQQRLKGGAVFTLAFIWPIMLNQNMRTSGLQVPPGESSSPGQGCPSQSSVSCLKCSPTWKLSRKWFCFLPEIDQQGLGGHLVLIAEDLANPVQTFLCCQNANGILNTPCSTEF